MKILILAGGGGTRLWPLSRHDLPKQFLHFGDPLSLLQRTAKRFLNGSIAEEIVVLTNLHHQHLVERQLAKIDPSRSIRVLVEPVRKNTAPAIALGIRYLEEQCRCQADDAILVIPSDHLLEPELVFLRCLEDVEQYARDGEMILFGIRPSKPETGYGYIQIGAQKMGPLYQVQRFVEKPDRRKAEQYLASRDYYWNAGMFVFSPKAFWKEAKLYAPTMVAAMQGNLDDCLSQFSQNPDVSIDYAIWEKSEKAVVCPLPISWSDIGCWDSVYDVMDKDENLNVKMGNVLEINTKTSLIFGSKKLIAVIGLEDLLIVDTEDATCISKKGESQKVKELVEILTRRKGKEVSSQDKVKLLYKTREAEIHSYELDALTSLTILIPKNKVAHWIGVKGRAKINGLNLEPPDSLSTTNPEQILIENATNESAELLLIQITTAFSEV